MSNLSIERLIAEQPKELQEIGKKVINNIRLTDKDALLLFEQSNLSFSGTLANFVRHRLHGNKTYFNRNFHIEPTNVCVFSCHLKPLPGSMIFPLLVPQPF